MTALSCQRAVWQPCRKRRISYKRSNSQLENSQQGKRIQRGALYPEMGRAVPCKRPGRCMLPRGYPRMPSWRATERAVSRGAGSSTPGAARSISVIGEGAARGGQIKTSQADPGRADNVAAAELLGTPDIVRPSRILEDAGNPGF